MITRTECLTLDDRDASIDNHMGDLIGDYLIIETSIDVKLYSTSYTMTSFTAEKCMRILCGHSTLERSVKGGSEGGKHDILTIIDPLQ